MAITSAGIGSGLDVEGIVSQLMQLERRPLSNLETKKLQFETELSAFGQLKSAVSSFRTAMNGLSSLDKFKLFSSTSSDQDVLSVTANSSAATGSFEIDVSRLAQRHKLGSTEHLNDATFAQALTIEVGGKSLTVNAAGDSLTLDEIRDLINESESNPGVTASVLNVGDDKQRLVLTAEDEGFENSITLSGGLETAIGLGTINRNAADEVISNLQDLDAEFFVDNYKVNTPGNNVSSVIEGLDFQLKAVGVSTATVNRDASGVASNVQKFIDAFNNLKTNINGLRSEGGPLEADSSLLSMENKIRDILNSRPNGLTTNVYTTLAEIGIGTNPETGMLELDKAKLDEALDENFNNVAELFALQDQGIAERLSDLANGFLGTDGLIKTREDGLNTQIRSNESIQERVVYTLEKKEEALRRKFGALDALLGSMQSMSNYLTNAFAAFQSSN